MNKTRIHVLIILAVILIIGLISLNNGKIGITKLVAYPSGCPAYGPLVVNAMDDTATTCLSVPPTGPYGDVSSWQPVGIAFAPPSIDTTGEGDPGSPTAGTFGSNWMKVNWFSLYPYCPQYIYLPASEFEDQGCGGGPQDWSCYDYVGFNVFIDPSLNFSKDPEPQSVAFFDGTITITASVNCHPDGVLIPFTWVQHVTVSIKWLGNQYDTVTGHQFNVANVQRVIINPPNVVFTDFGTGQQSGLVSSGEPYYLDNWVPIYYDDLSLGAGLTAYGSPPLITITTINQSPLHGAYIAVSPYAGALISGLTPTAYEVYRSLVIAPTTASLAAAQNGPYILIKDSPIKYDQFIPQDITDTTCIGGGYVCYKILTTNNGVSPYPTVQISNTVNASYHEARLQDVAAACWWVDAIPTATVTPTPTFVCGPLGCPSPMPTGTITPTITPTPIPTLPPDINNAHVYPNPFNPNGGSKTFYINNVQVGTKIFIYTMDGMLVKDGVTTGAGGPGTFGTFVWDGKNKNGSKVVSGLYYLVLQDPNNNNKTRVIRVIICYKCDPVYHPGS